MTCFNLPTKVMLTLMLVFVTAFPDAAFAQGGSFMSPASQIAADQKSHLIWVTMITMIAIVPVFVLLPIILLKYRRSKKGADYRPDWEFSLPLEILMWGGPFLLVGILSWTLWGSTHKLDPYAAIQSDNPTINVQVVGLDWKWLFIYPDLGIATVGEMAIPVNHPVAMTLTTDTVMQSFIISSLAGQIYAMPGMTTELHVMAAQTGTFQGENMQYNGNGFVDQKFATLAMEPAAFEAWAQKVKTDGVALDQKAYDTLAIQSSQADAHKTLSTAAMPAKAIYLTLPDTQLFHKIVKRYHSGQPLKLNQQPGTADFATATKENSP